MEKCPYCKIPLEIVALREYLPGQEIEGWVFWCSQCRRYFAAPTDDQVRQFLHKSLSQQCTNRFPPPLSAHDGVQ